MTGRTAVLLPLAAFIASCGGDPVPKPRGYFRIDLPEVAYTRWADSSVLSAEVPVYCTPKARKNEATARWYDLRFPGQRATVHLTWSAVQGNLPALIDDAHTFKDKHQQMATRIGRERVLRDDARVFGTLFAVEGDVASPCVFYLTDSTANFLYGALYFDARPNADSLAPVTERLRNDIRHFAHTLRWLGNGRP